MSWFCCSAGGRMHSLKCNIILHNHLISEVNNLDHYICLMNQIEWETWLYCNSQGYCCGLTETPIGPFIWILSFQLVDLVGKDWEVWPCWGRCATGYRLCGFRRLLHSHLALCLMLVDLEVCSWLLLQSHVCLLVNMPHTVMVIDSNPLKLWALKLNAFFYKFPWL